MQLKTLQLANFKNYADVRVSFSPKVNVLVGNNGSGKTNLLDAIYYLSMTRSATSPADTYCIRHGEQHFFLRGAISIGNDEKDLSAGFQTGAKKIFKEGANEYQKISDHIGKYPVVLIAPDDTDLVKEGSEARRRFFDSMISQIDRVYLDSLIQYNHALKQRNGLLKMFSENHRVDPIALDAYDDLLIRHGSRLHHRRKLFVEEYNPLFQRYYRFIVSEDEAGLIYNSELNGQSFHDGLSERRSRDLFLQRTTFGTHRDDYHFTLGPGDLKRLGSQGQQKSFVIALKLAQFEIMKQHKGFSPIMLLDDIFDKLDDFRIERLLDLIKKGELGQLFITDARPDRTSALLEQVNVTSSLYRAGGGTLKEV